MLLAPEVSRRSSGTPVKFRIRSDLLSGNLCALEKDVFAPLAVGSKYVDAMYRGERESDPSVPVP